MLVRTPGSRSGAGVGSRLRGNDGGSGAASGASMFLMDKDGVAAFSYRDLTCWSGPWVPAFAGMTEWGAGMARWATERVGASALWV